MATSNVQVEYDESFKDQNFRFYLLISQSENKEGNESVCLSIQKEKGASLGLTVANSFLDFKTAL